MAIVSSEKCTENEKFRLSSEKCTENEKFRLSSEKCTENEKISQKIFFDFLKKTLAKVFSVGIIGLMKST